MSLEYIAGGYGLPAEFAWISEDVAHCHSRYCAMHFGHRIERRFSANCTTKSYKYIPWSQKYPLTGLCDSPTRFYDSNAIQNASDRSEELRVGKEWVSTCRYRG